MAVLPEASTSILRSEADSSSPVRTHMEGGARVARRYGDNPAQRIRPGPPGAFQDCGAHSRNLLLVTDFLLELTDGVAYMTTRHETDRDLTREVPASTPRGLSLDLAGLRVNGAQLGIMLGVSRQAVSSAVKRGTISAAGPDGLFDSRRAVREWMANTDPTRVRARAMKPGAEMVAELRERVQALAEDAANAHKELAIEREWGDKREAAATFRAEDAADQALTRFTKALVHRFAEAGAAHAAGRLARWLDEVVAVEFYRQSLDEYRADFPDDEAGSAADPPA